MDVSKKGGILLMITNLRELNDVVNEVANFIVKTAADSSMSGNYIFDYDSVANLISEEDYLNYFDLIEDELFSRKEILDLDASNNEFDVILDLSYCKAYEWQPGDEEFFGCTEEEYDNNFVATPVAQPLSMSRMAEIGDNAVKSVQEWFKEPYAELTESLGISDKELFHLDLVSDLDNEPKIEYFTMSTEIDAHLTSEHVSSIEEALEVYKNFGEAGKGKALYYSISDGKEEHHDILLESWDGQKSVSMISFKELEENALIKNNTELQLAVVKAMQEVYSFDEKLWNKRTELEKQLGIFDRVVDNTKDLISGKWRVHLVKEGEHYGANNSLVHNEKDPLVEFWDMSTDKAKFSEGQFVSRYYLSTLLDNKWGSSLDEMVAGNRAFCLDADVPSWIVAPADLKDIAAWLKEKDVQLNRKEPLKEQINAADIKRASQSKETIDKDLER